jgi:SAM-dependent methyltransferase
MTEINDVYTFMDMLTGYQPAMLIMAAENLRLYDAVSTEPRPVADIASDLGADADSLQPVLTSLARLGLLRESNEGFATTPFAAEHLGEGRDLALVVQKEEYFARAWLSLDEVTRTAEPALEPWRSRLQTQPDVAEMFLAALNVLAEHVGPKLWELPELAPGKRVLDVGGGFGFYARRLVAAGSNVVLVDLPELLSAIGQRLEDLPDGSVELIAADVLSERSCGVDPGSIDTALVSHMLHDLSVDAGTELLRRVHTAIRPGGELVVNDFAGDSGPGAFGPMFDVMMRVETGGAAHELSTLLSMVQDAGFEHAHRHELQEPLTVIKATRV